MLFNLTSMRFSRSTHLLKCLSLGILASIIRTGWPILLELIDLVNSVLIFQSETTLLIWLTCLLGPLTVTLTVLLFWIYSLLMLVFVLQLLSLHWQILIMLLSVSIDSLSNSKWDVQFRRIAYDYSCADSDGLSDHFEDVSCEDNFTLNASAAAACEFCEWVQLGTDAYIHHCKHHVKPHSFLCFSAVCAPTIVHKIHFFCFYQPNKSSESIAKFREASNRYKSVLEAAKLEYANKKIQANNFPETALGTFSKLLIVFLRKANLLTPPLFNNPKELSSSSPKTNLFAKNFSKDFNLDDSGISLSVFPSRTNQKLHNISVLHKTVKKFLTNFDSSKTSGPDYIPLVVLKHFEPKLSHKLAELFNMWLNNSSQFVGRAHWWSLYLQILGKGLQLKTTALLVFLLWSLKNL